MGEIGANFNFASLFHYTQELCIKKNIFWNFRKYSSLILEQNSRTLIFLAIRLLQLQQKIRKVGICSIISKQKKTFLYIVKLDTVIFIPNIFPPWHFVNPHN